MAVVIHDCLCGLVWSPHVCFHLSSVCLFKVCGCAIGYNRSLLELCVFSFNGKLMSEYSPRSPLSLSSGSNSSRSDMQDSIPPPDTVVQCPNPVMSDGVRLNHTSQPIDPTHPTYSDVLKFGLGSHGGHNMPPSESKYCA